MPIAPPQPFMTLLWNGRTYARCPVCRRYGRLGWSHICGPLPDWYPSPQELEEAMARCQQEIMKMGPVLTIPRGNGR